MNLDKALELIKTVCALYQGNLKDHEQIQAALKVIFEALNDKKSK